jgi:2-dehydropantoate 2-reductase
MGEAGAALKGRDMKICIFGAGAIGGYMGVKLAQAGADVSLVARGPHLAAMKEKGLTLIEEGGDRHGAGDGVGGPRRAWPAGLRDRDAQGAFGAAGGGAKMQPLIGPETTVVSGVNGVPWWYFHKIGGDLEGTRLESVDPGNAQWDGFGPDRVLGCVVYPAAEVSSPV